ncbi:MAG: penicillin-binding protein, partial [Bacilli bacterium]|nr:penicillin-binding protein [Bacilli bacterium]
MKIKKEKTEKVKKVKKVKKKKKFSIKNAILIFIISAGIIVASSVLAFALYIIVTSPDFVPQELYTKESSIIYARDGKTEIARYGAENVELVTYNDLPQVLIDALVATEDSRFFQHNGFDAARFIKASLGQLRGQNAGGASTLSMQVIKNTYTGTEAKGIEGIIRKFTDIYMAVFKLEAVYTKEEIMEFYLNSQWLGGGSTYYKATAGIEQGSQYYFGKSVSDLTLSEAALLVGMFNNPSYFNPYINPENATNRRSTVLSLMVRHGYITEEEREFADSVPVQSLLAEHKNDTSSEYQEFIDFVLYQVEKETGDDPYRVPMAIYTTLDPDIQKTLNQLSNGELYKFVNDKVQYGMAITSTEDGSIQALSAGRNYSPKGTHRGVGKRNYISSQGIQRQPGSTAKILFDYGPYIEYLNGSTGTIFIDKPWNYTKGGGVVNADRGYMGPITMRTALVQSRNTTAVQAFQQVANEVGLDKIADFVHSLGIDYGENLYESYAIGGGVYVDPLTMSAAYAAYGRGGIYIEPYSFTKVVYLETDEVWSHPVEKKRVMSEQTAYMITDMLVTAGQQGIGGNFSISGTNIAAKGGTSTISAADAKANGIPSSATPDHWNITYSPDYSIALWYGYDKNTDGYTTSGTGSVARKAIMKAVATKVYKKNSKFKKPGGVTSVTIEKETYPTQLASNYTPSSFKLTEYYKNGYEPSEVSPRFDTLENPTGGNSTFDGTNITISWNAIETPKGYENN